MIELLACKLGRNDEVPNIELAERLCESADENGVREIATGLQSKEQAVANDCIKVLYEVGQRKPEMIAGFANDFIAALSSKNNRLVWGSMTALAYVAPLAPDLLYKRLPEIIAAYKKGSVITVDNSISVFAEICRAKSDYQKEIFPFLLGHLANCRAKEIPQHAERMVICVNGNNKAAFIAALEKRTNELSDSQNKRVKKLIRSMA